MQKLRSARSFNHIAVLTHDTAETHRFYTEILGLDLISAVREEQVPSTGEHTPFLHTFFALEDGSCLAFFELVGQGEVDIDDGVPKWVRHFAMNVDTYEELLEWKEHLEACQVDVLGVVDHGGIWQSIYFFDPNGLRLEFTWQKRGLAEGDRIRGHELLEAWIEERASDRRHVS